MTQREGERTAPSPDEEARELQATTLECGNCGHSAPRDATEWLVHDQGDPGIGDPLRVRECPVCSALVDIGPRMNR